MIPVNSIVVVTEKEQKKVGRLLYHLIEKKGLKAVLWSYDLYIKNEVKTSPLNHTIFLGTNDVTEAFTSLVKDWTEDQGVRIGFDHKKAFIQQYAKPTNLDELDVQLKKTSKGIIGLYALVLFLFGAIGGTAMWVTHKVLKTHKKNKATIAKQYGYGSLKFLEEMFEDFIAVK